MRVPTRSCCSDDPGTPPPAVATLLHGLAHPDVRALAALVATPSLVGPGATVALLEDRWRWARLIERRDWLAALDAQPAPLLLHLRQSNDRQLGRYAEALWQFWFAELPGARVHAAGLPVKDGTAVRGEFDFIVTLPGLPGVSHLETGYKFFLYCPPGLGMERCVGPDPSDRLDRKWRHMVEVQLPLSRTAWGRAALPAGLDPDAITPRACLQGCVFYPLGGGGVSPTGRPEGEHRSAQHGGASGCPTGRPEGEHRSAQHEGGPASPVPTALAPGHARGAWCRFDAAAVWARHAPRWTILDKRAWIAPAQVPQATTGAAAPRTAADVQAELERHFAGSRQARLVAGLVPQGDGWRESLRVFVVAPGWAGADDRDSNTPSPA